MPRLSSFIRSALSFYRPGYAAEIVGLLQSADYRVLRYLGAYWSTQDFSAVRASSVTPTTRNRALMLFVSLGSLMQALAGVIVLAYNLWNEVAGALPFGLALVISYPIVWAHLLALIYAAYKGLWLVMHAKKAGRMLVCRILEWQAVRLRAGHQFTLIAVVGSMGKTSTKLAIAHTLEPTRRVIYQTGNYNDRVTAPLVLFGQQLPGLLNVPAWMKIFVRNEQTIRRPHFYDMAVLELGTDHPGQIAQFAYLKPDLTVVTAITPEHMEYFGTLDAVAAEELAVCEYSAQVLVNAGDTPQKYLKGRKVLTYGLTGSVDFQASGYKPEGLHGGTVSLRLQDRAAFAGHAAILGEQGVKILLAAAAAGHLVGLDGAELKKGLAEVKPFAGRMQVLQGIKNSTIIDDTYNASPAPVIAALDVLYAADAPQRIAILGSMNELGDYSPQAHREVGEYCRGDKLDIVVTIGADAEKYLAPTAAANGCEIKCFTSPYEAGEYVKSQLMKDAVVLAEGSQNRVFAEEALKVLLKNTGDAKKLVRQSAGWMKVKREQFGVVLD